MRPLLSDDSSVRVFTGDYYNPAPSIDLPCVDVAGKPRVGHGRFVFIRSDGSAYYAIVGADNSGSPPVDFGLASLTP